MDARTRPYPDVDPTDAQPLLLDRSWCAIANRDVRAGRAEAAWIAEPPHAHAVDIVRNHAEADVPPLFATPRGAALTF